MIVNRIALKRQPTILTLLIIIVIAGAYSYLTLPRESFPDITIPYVFVTTTYEGVSPSDMEELVTIPIERKLKGIADVEEIRSTSAEGISTVAVKFLPSVDIDDALQKVRDRVDQAKNDLPADLKDDPVIKEVNFSDLPVIRVVLSGDFSLRRLQRFAEDLKDKIESIQGVLDAPISGGLEREIHVEFDLDRVGAYNVPFSSLISAVTRSNVNMPGGSMDIGEGKYLVRVPEDFKHPSEIFSIVAFVRDGKPVYLRDLAVITDSHKDPLTRTRINGKTSVTIAVQKRSGENIVRVTDEVKKAVEEMRPLLPPSLGIDLTADMSNDVRLMVADLENNILSGLLLVLAVIFVFIGGQSAVFIALAIPYSMFITFILLMGSGISMNMVVLFSLILALGMLVDNGIVIVENIYRHMQEGEGRLEAATAATDEVAWPVITSTLTTLGAFFPMIFWPGIMGEFMKYLPITLIMALSASLFVALAINPVLSARYQRVTIETKRSRKDGLIIRTYLSFLMWALNHRLILVLSAFALLLASVASYGAFGRGTEFFPETEPRRAYITVKAPEGTNLDASDAIVAQVEKTAAQYEDIHYIIANVGAVGGDPFSQGGTGTHINRVVIDFKDFHEREKPSSEIVDELRTRLLKDIRGAEVQVEKEKEGPPTGPPVNLEISGKDIVVLGELAQRARKIIEQIPGIVDLKDNFVRGKPEITVRIDKEKAALFNLDTLTIATTVKSAINGAKVGVFREGKDEYDIIAKLPEKDRRSLESIKRLTISGPAGEPVPITSVADIGVSSGLGAIMRLDQKRVVTVSANVSGRLANDAIRDIEKRLVEQVEWPRGYSFRFTGEQREQEKAQAFLIKAFAATLFLIAIILITQFNSVATPLIILTSVLLSLIGVFLGLLVTDTAFGIIMTGIGVISLAGVVVNNAIVLIDYSNQLRDKGLSYRESLIKAGLVRFRPVMLTAITTILGLLPMAAGVSVDFRKLTLEVGSESSQWWGPMAVAVIFGLGVATLLTLVIVPVLCSLADDMRGRFKRPG
ncbi:MAG: AcrB/AcrD/AcrF family protein [Deltaproteobacteria bacterium CG_4_8_14_3_um_filter_51_11]|nr:efflux RND transporter permease subunit [bacterium]PIP47921.1 MAG: acriflavin resistance protein [Deltaproteobacteria bacterium CG23_combo_of_CG06-09_8_20_14_all_51_20]PIX18527.1 MAG: AcrB/AcrD/AcrF family protein [Deltaproteobacteria bacterium CG_4_8_14_3_um_filter_51_11]